MDMPEEIHLWKNAFHEIKPYKNPDSVKYVKASKYDELKALSERMAESIKESDTNLMIESLAEYTNFMKDKG